jgi:NhaA family Na+:H+ antiporter
LPDATTWHHIVGVAAVAGIGFTVSIFIAQLGLEPADQLADAKAGILTASVVAALLGAALLRTASRRSPRRSQDSRDHPVSSSASHGS